MVFHKVLQAHVRARVEARPAAGLFDKPTESSMIATWSGGARASMVFHKVVQTHVRAPVEARPAAGHFDKPTERIVIATWSGAAWHVLRSIGMHFSLT